MNTHVIKRWSKANSGLLFCCLLVLCLTVAYGLGLLSPIAGLGVCGLMLAGYGFYFWVYYRWYRKLEDLAGFSEYYHEIFRLPHYMFSLLCLLGVLALVFYQFGQIVPLYTMPDEWNHPIFIGARLVIEVVDALSLGWYSMFNINAFDITFANTTSRFFFKALSTMTEVLIITRLISLYRDWKKGNADIEAIFTSDLAYKNYMHTLNPRKIRALLKCLSEKTEAEDVFKILNGLMRKEHRKVRDAFLEQLQTTDDLRIAKVCVNYFSKHRDHRFRKVCRNLPQGSIRDYAERAVPGAFARPSKKRRPTRNAGKAAPKNSRTPRKRPSSRKRPPRQNAK